VAGGVDDEVIRVQAECRYLSAEIQRLQTDNSKLRVWGFIFTACMMVSGVFLGLGESLLFVSHIMTF